MTATEPAFAIYSISEKALTIEFGNEIDDSILQKITSFNNLINQNPFPGFSITVPAYTTLTVFYDPVQVISSHLPGADCFEKVSTYLTSLKSKKDNTAIASTNTITIPVCYGGEFGPDLQDVADVHNLTIDQVVKLHSAAAYKVYMIGFVPGFAYLGGMPDILATPRKSTPRSKVPPGSIGIAGMQTGIYPLQTPGGWQLIGRAPLQLFDANRAQPSLLKAGDEVVFEPIDIDEYNSLLNN